MNHFGGITAPLFIPVREDGKTDYRALDNYILFLKEREIKNIFVGGTSGEFVNFSREERAEQLKHISSVFTDLNILYNVTGVNYQDLVYHIATAKDVGCGSVSVTAPYFHKYDYLALKQYFETISSLTDGLDLYLYNIPAMTGNPITPALVKELCETCPNIKGIKDSSMDFTNLEELLITVPERFQIITGNDAEILAGLRGGCVGAIVALANVFPEICLAIYHNYMMRNEDKAWKYQAAIIKARNACRSIMPIMSHKYLLELRGINMGTAHFPLRELNENEREKLRKVSEELLDVL